MFYRKISFILFLIMIISGCAEEKRAVENNIQPAETNNMYYTITFYGNGGTGLMDSLKVKQGESVLLPANKFVNEGRVFAGWSNDYKNSSILYNDLDVIDNISEDINLYAVWNTISESESEDNNKEQDIQVYKITLYGKDSSEYVSIEAAKGESIVLPANKFVNEGKVFAGWSLSPESSYFTYDDMQQIENISNDLVLYAVWQQQDTDKKYYKITFDANNGTGEKYSKYFQEGVNDIDYTDFQNQGFYFLGWGFSTDDKQPVFQDGDYISAYNDTTYYAVWSKTAVKVSFNSNGGTGSMKDMYVLPNSTFTIPVKINMHKYNSRLAGYSLADDEYVNYYIPGISVQAGTDDMVLYAVWHLVDTNLGGSYDKYAGSILWLNGVDVRQEDWKLVKTTNDLMTAEWHERSNWYDIYQGSYNMCWAAAVSNVLHWWFNINKDYIARYESEHKKYTGPSSIYKAKGGSDIFEYFKSNWKNEGNFPTVAYTWFLSGSSQAENGGFFKDVFGSQNLAETIKGFNRKIFNEKIVESFENSDAVLINENSSRGAHALTVWGAEFGSDGFINALYITNSADYTLLTADDTDGGLMRVEVVYKDGIYPALKYYEDVIEPVTALYILSSGKKQWQSFFNNQ